jgi:hypothetical protein
MSNGNIIGIYYIKNYKGFGGYRTGEDICDIYNINYDDFNEYEIKNLIDIGDMNKLTLYHYSHNNNCFNTRFFNNIVSTNNNTLIKRSVEIQGNDIIINEISWYKYLSSYNIDYIPNIFNYNENDFEFEMEKVNAEPLYLNFNNFDDDKKMILLKDIYDILDNLHSIHQNKISIEEYYRDIQIECHEKIISRLNKVKPLLDYFGSIEYVNDIFINNDINYVLNKCLNNIKNNGNIGYSIIHGDCQFSNILYNKDTNTITLIDPRGYFGKSKIFGDKNYDYAKVLYALSGYDTFNNNNLYYITNYDRVNKRILFEINNNLHLIDSIKREIGEKYINISTISYLVIIWLGLAQYNQNNILKCVTSYYNGLYLFAKYLE